MKIFFLAPRVSKQSLPKQYESILTSCKNLQHTILYEHIFASHPKKIQESYRSLIDALKKTDVVIVEGTSLNAEISRLVSIALQYHIPTLVLYQKDNPEVYVFESTRLLTLKHYSETTLQSILKKYLEKVDKKKLLYRFNLMLSKEMDHFLMDKSKDIKVSKADYIRTLILQDMGNTKKSA